jgi:hypothetical protein
VRWRATSMTCSPPSRMVTGNRLLIGRSGNLIGRCHGVDSGNGQVNHDCQSTTRGAVVGAARPPSLACASIAFAQVRRQMRLRLGARFGPSTWGTHLRPSRTSAEPSAVILRNRWYPRDSRQIRACALRTERVPPLRVAPVCQSSSSRASRVYSAKGQEGAGGIWARSIRRRRTRQITNTTRPTSAATRRTPSASITIANGLKPNAGGPAARIVST